jgi:hypothetical protein
MATQAEAGPSRTVYPVRSPSEDSPAGFEKWRRSLSQFTGLGLSESEKAYWQEEKDYNQCEKWKAALMTDSKYLSHDLGLADQVIKVQWLLSCSNTCVYPDAHSQYPQSNVIHALTLTLEDSRLTTGSYSVRIDLQANAIWRIRWHMS